MSKPPDNIKKIWFTFAHGPLRCEMCGATYGLEAHHIVRRELHIAWMPENAILLCHDHHVAAHKDKPYFRWALKGKWPERWKWVDDNENKTATWDEVREALLVAMVATVFQETEA